MNSVPVFVAAATLTVMTMRFGVRDRSLCKRLAPGTKLEFEFVRQGWQYLVTAANWRHAKRLA